MISEDTINNTNLSKEKLRNFEGIAQSIVFLFTKL